MLLAEITSFKNYEYIYKFNEDIPHIGRLQIISNEGIRNAKDYIQLPEDINQESLRIRTWNKGDVMQTKIGKKKVNKIFNELKLNSLQKKEALLVANGDNILWIINLKKAYIMNPSEFIIIKN